MKTRPIHPEEAALVRWLVSLAPAEKQSALAEQVPGLVVSARCDCGCPSVDFLVEGQAGTAAVVTEAEGHAPDGTAVGVLLWARSGRISGLEVYATEDRETSSLPRPDGLHRSALLGPV
jgi:hypothetical protein